MRSERTELHGADGQRLEARIDAPDAHTAAHAPFAYMSVINGLHRSGEGPFRLIAVTRDGLGERQLPPTPALQ